METYVCEEPDNQKENPKVHQEHYHMSEHKNDQNVKGNHMEKGDSDMEMQVVRGGMNNPNNNMMTDDDTSSGESLPPPNWADVARRRAMRPSVSVIQFNPATRDERVTSIMVDPRVRANMDVDIVIFRREMVLGEIAPVVAAAMSTESTDLRLSLPDEGQLELPPWIQLPQCATGYI